jgi:hypothetical protein
MSKNPLVNGFAAFVYISLLVLVMTWGSRLVPHPNSFVMPVIMICLFTLSAAVMAYLFCFQPIQLYFDGKKKQAVRLFLQTVGVFGGITLLMLALLFSRLIP